MQDVIPVVLAYDGIRIVCGLLGLWASGAKRRPRLEGWLLGFFLGLLGVLIEAMLPSGAEAQGRAKRRRPTPEYYREPERNETEETVGDWLTQPRNPGP